VWTGDYKLLQELAFDNQYVGQMNYKLLFVWNPLERDFKRDKSNGDAMNRVSTG
jgi:hypothetical protein